MQHSNTMHNLFKLIAQKIFDYCVFYKNTMHIQKMVKFISHYTSEHKSGEHKAQIGPATGYIVLCFA